MAKKLVVAKNLITEIVSEAVGEDALGIVFYLKGKKDISEFKIAKDTKTEIHGVRNILYRLHSQNLVMYRRKKDREKGWYISYWTFNPKRIGELVEILKKKKLEKYKVRLEAEEKNKGNYFICPQACVRMDFYTATEHDFKCPECGSILNHQDNEKTIDGLRANISRLQKELKAC
jgi:transcription initiation factor TFIIE subunit alpha